MPYRLILCPNICPVNVSGLWRTFSLITFCTATGLAGPKLEIEGEARANFGKYPSRESKVAKFVIRNGGDEPLSIQKVRKTCGCLDVSYRKKAIKPGKSSVVKVTVLAEKVSHAYSKHVFIESNDPGKKFLKLQVMGNAVPAVEIKPHDKVNAGGIAAAQEWSRTFALATYEDGVKLGEPAIESQLDANAEVKENPEKPGQYLLTLDMTPGTEQKRFRCVVTVPVVRPRKCKPLKLVVHGSVLAGKKQAVAP